jgi:hypothetical protein
MMDHGNAIFTVVCRFACHRQSISLHDITGIEFLVHYRYAIPRPNPAEALGETCDSLSRMDSADNLVDILGCRHEEIELPMLGAAFFERGLLASKSFPIVSVDSPHRMCSGATHRTALLCSYIAPACDQPQTKFQPFPPLWLKEYECCRRYPWRGR